MAIGSGYLVDSNWRECLFIPFSDLVLPSRECGIVLHRSWDTNHTGSFMGKGTEDKSLWEMDLELIIRDRVLKGLRNSAVTFCLTQ